MDRNPRRTKARPREIEAVPSRHLSLLFGFFALFVVLAVIDTGQTVYALALPHSPLHESMPVGAALVSLAGPAGLIIGKVFSIVGIAWAVRILLRFGRVGWTLTVALLVLVLAEHIVCVASNAVILATLAH